MSRITPIPVPLRPLVVMVVIGTGVLLMLATASAPGNIDYPRILLWLALTLICSALPVHLPGGIYASISTAPLLAAVFDQMLPNPFACVWIALVGTLGLRDLRRQAPWYATLFNRSNMALAAYAAWLVLEGSRTASFGNAALTSGIQIVLAGGAFAIVNLGLALVAASVRTSQPLSRVWALSIRNVVVGFAAQVPLGWLMAQVANTAGQWATLLFLVPLLLARYSFSKYTEIRDLFFGSVSALSQAIDAKDGFTRGHADRVSRIAGAVAREMGLSEGDIEQIELAGLLHDIGKIGVEDKILLKPMRLDPDELELMRRHPVYGAAILEPSAALRPLVPLVLAHHESFDGSGYPQGLKGNAIPLGARIIIVADAYEAMTSDRIYRKAIGHDRAMEQLDKYRGRQFDPGVVDALDVLLKRRGAQAFEVSDLPPINYETLADLRRRLAQDATRTANAG